MNFDWAKELNTAITVSDENGIIVYMNDKSIKTFGGKSLVGEPLSACHKTESNQKIEEMMKTAKPNTYTIEKQGQKKLIHQEPWFEDGRLKGLVEFSIVLPAEMPHKVRG